MFLSSSLNLLKSSDFSKVFCFSWCLGANFHNRYNLLFRVLLIYPKICLQGIVSPPSDKLRQMEWLNSEWQWLSVSPQLRIDVLHVPAERLAVQLPPQRDTVCNATRRKNTRACWDKQRERERKVEREEWRMCERNILNAEHPADDSTLSWWGFY